MVLQSGKHGKATRIIPFSKATKAPGGGIIGTGGGGFVGGGGAVQPTPTEPEQPTQPIGTIVLDSQTQRPIIFTSGGQQYFKTTTGERISLTTGAPISPPSTQIIQPTQQVGGAPIPPKLGQAPNIFTNAFGFTTPERFKQPVIETEGAIRAAPPKLAKQTLISRATEPVRREIRDFLRGATFQQQPFFEEAPAPSGGLSFTFGLIGGIATFGAAPKAKAAKGIITAAKTKKVAAVFPKILEVVKTAPTKISKITPPKLKAALDITQKAAKTRAGKFFKFVGLQTTKAIAIPTAAKGISRVTAPEEIREVIKTPGFKGVVSTAFEAETKATFQKGIIPGIAFQLSPFFSGSKSEFIKSVKTQAETRGLTKSETDTFVKAALRQRTAAAIGEGLTLLELSRGAEAFGRKGVREIFKKGVTIPKKKAFSTIFKKTAPTIGLAGIGEAGGQELAQQISRGEKLQVLPQFKDGFKFGIVGAGAAGFVSAAVLGGTIAGLRPTKPAVSKVVEVGAFIGDPFEKPADILQDLTEAATRRLTGKPVQKIVLTKVLTPTAAFNIGLGKPKPTPTPKPTPKPTPTPKPKPKPTPTVTSVDTLTDIIIGTPVPTPTKKPTPTFTISPPTPTPGTPTPTPPTPTIGIPTPADIITPIETPVDVPTPITTTIPISTTIPVFTPTLKFPPPVPLLLPFGAGRGGARKGKRIKFIDELAAGTALIDKLAGRPSFPTERYLKKSQKQIKEKLKVIREKKREKKKKTFDFNKLLLG